MGGSAILGGGRVGNRVPGVKSTKIRKNRAAGAIFLVQSAVRRSENAENDVFCAAGAIFFGFSGPNSEISGSGNPNPKIRGGSQGRGLGASLDIGSRVGGGGTLFVGGSRKRSKKTFQKYYLS